MILIANVLLAGVVLLIISLVAMAVFYMFPTASTGQNISRAVAKSCFFTGLGIQTILPLLMLIGFFSPVLGGG